MKLFGLFEYTYDYYEWEELQVASSDESKLREWANNNLPDLEIFTVGEHETNYKGKAHLLIKEIDVL